MSKKKKQAAKSQEPAPEPIEPTTEPVSEQPSTAAVTPAFGEIDRLWLGGAVLVTLVATFWRFYDITIRPFHHDEGVNAHFLKNLIGEGLYKYDPSNYHGPTLYYISLFFVKLFGYEMGPLRASMAIFGVLMVVLVLYLRQYIGRVGSLAAAFLLAISPGMVFISRYYIHEIFFVFCSIAIVVSVVFFIEKKEAGYGAVAWMAILLLTAFLPSALNLATAAGGENATTVWVFRLLFMLIEAVLAYFVIRMLLGWDGGRPIYLILAGASVALIFATKETAFITIGTMIIACVCVAIWRKLWPARALDRSAMRAVIGFHAVVGLIALIANAQLIDGVKWIYNTIAYNPFRPPEVFVFWSIVFLTVVSIAAWVLFIRQMKAANTSETEEPVELTWANFRRSLGDNQNALMIIGASAVALAYVFVLFFSSFFTYAEGVMKAFEAYAIWTKTGNKDHTMHGYLGYLKWGLKIESAILILSLLGLLIAFLKARHRFAMFSGLWALGLFLAYSIIPYKTPWLALSFILPMCIVAGYGLGELFESKNRQLMAAAAVLLISATAVLSYQAYQANFVRYDDDEIVYVYAHTRRGFLDLMREVDHYAQKSGKGRDAVIEVLTPEYWPMTWYTKDYTKVNYFGNLVDVKDSEIIITRKGDQDAGAIQKYGANYRYVGVYPLRPGVNLVLLVRRDIADPDDQEVNKVLEYKVVPGYTN